MLDTVREIETPEGIALRLRAAGALPRAQAWMVDMLLRMGVFIMAMIPLSLFGMGGNGLAMLLLFALTWVYSVVCEVWLGGQTLGKRALGLRVVNADGTPVTWLPSVVRNLLRAVDVLPGVYGVGLVSTLIDPYARRLGDIVAGTMVIHAVELPAGQQVPTFAAVPLPVVLAADEQAALVEFAERSAQLTPQRQEELANLLTPLTGRNDTAAVRQLIGHANWLLGRP
ncbi:RDD family protein [Rhodanobacter panaciterrae]|uniref:RDD family protein n=1 Tax=Rhodanobacter panaciterrae TaxID=490572 RepID=A0ABQ2ZY83_9GAMM|nr:RDD family protein [Rhodanobacter panaciterrae]GGY26149.1 RDD family protein [Rhodanobacter panaciterrae]